MEPPAPVPQPGPVEQPSRPAGDPRKRAALKRALADARQTMKDRDLIAAKTFLDRAAAIAQSPEDEAELAQVETYHANLTEFWRMIHKAMGSFNGGEVITLRGRPIAIVESAPGKLIFRDRGQNYTYQPHRLTGDWIELLVNRSFAKDPTSMVLYGTFLALDGDGDPQRAGQLWRQAGREGAEIGVLIGQPEEGPGAAPSHSAPPADAAELKRAEQILRQSHSTAFDQATSVAGKVRLADKMLAVAAESATDPNQRFVALTTARDTAISAGEPELVFLAIERLDASYSIDAQAMRLTALEAMGRNVHGTRTSNELAERSLAMASQLVEAKQLDRAARLALTALAAARKSGNLLLMRKATLAVDEIKSAREKR
ncbi:MAG: hypothetical protein HQ581_25435 [Planctomycetes bacterium]|nr:hypothetical protein [Planctomycetota bacterium]